MRIHTVLDKMHCGAQQTTCFVHSTQAPEAQSRAGIALAFRHSVLTFTAFVVAAQVTWSAQLAPTGLGGPASYANWAPILREASF